MVSDFEQRLAEVLGARLPAPFTGRVDVPPGANTGERPRLLVGVSELRMLEPEFRSVRPELVPGANDPRRVLRLGCSVGVVAQRAAAQTRADQLLLIDAALFALGDDGFRDGSALRDDGDQGFFIQSLRIAGASTAFDSSDAVQAIQLAAEGLFWPIGSAGETGAPIEEVRVRGNVLPIAVEFARALLVAGAGPVEFSLRVSALPNMRVTEGAASALAPSTLAVTVLAANGGAGQGSLSGGDAGASGVRLLPVVDGMATVSYTPPPQAAREQLLIALPNESGGLGIELQRVPLRVRGG